MGNVLIYYPFALAEKADSGSKLRPLEMIRAFEQWGETNGFNIYIISGNTVERAEQFEKLKQTNVLDHLTFCYVENQTIPIWLTDPNHIPKRPMIDHQIFRYLKNRNVPVGVFYRDVYWKFDEIYPLKGWKKAIMRKVYRYEEKFLEKYANVIFLPSSQMGKFVDVNITKVPLPPGGKMLSEPEKKSIQDKVKALYVGGISHRDYGLPLMLDSLEQVKKNGFSLELSIVCRAEEFQSVDPVLRDRMTQLDVIVKHISGKELDTYYKEMHFAIVPRYRSTYNDFSVPVKLVEYLSNRLPVVVTDCLAQKDLVESGPYGEVCEAEPSSMVNAFQRMIEKWEHYDRNIDKTFLQKHSWISRVETVAESLQKEEKR